MQGGWTPEMSSRLLLFGNSFSEERWIFKQLRGKSLYTQELVMITEQGSLVVLVENDVITLLGLVTRTILGIELMVHINAFR